MIISTDDVVLIGFVLFCIILLFIGFIQRIKINKGMNEFYLKYHKQFKVTLEIKGVIKQVVVPGFSKSEMFARIWSYLPKEDRYLLEKENVLDLIKIKKIEVIK